MKVQIEKTGDWDKLSKIFRHMDRRTERFKHVVMRDFMKEFERLVKSRIPDDPELEVYKNSISMRELRASYTKGDFGYALISDPKPIALKELSEKDHVIYVLPGDEPADMMGVLLQQYSPWAKDQVPEEIGEVPGIELVHRKVTKDEVDRTRERNIETVRKYAADFQRAAWKVTPQNEKKIKTPKSVPDLMFYAIRLEFGLFVARVQHWGFAYKKRAQILREMFRNPKRYGKYLLDPTFTGWVKPLRKLKPMPIQAFKSGYLAFEKKIVKQ